MGSELEILGSAQDFGIGSLRFWHWSSRFWDWSLRFWDQDLEILGLELGSIPRATEGEEEAGAAPPSSLPQPAGLEADV